jgi:hypothetical protein
MLAEQNWGRLQEVKTYGPEVDSFDEQAEENAMLDHHRETCIDPHCHVCGILNG